MHRIPCGDRYLPATQFGKADTSVCLPTTSPEPFKVSPRHNLDRETIVVPHPNRYRLQEVHQIELAGRKTLNEGDHPRINVGLSALIPSSSKKPLAWATSSTVASVIGRYPIRKISSSGGWMLAHAEALAVKPNVAASPPNASVSIRKSLRPISCFCKYFRSSGLISSPVFSTVNSFSVGSFSHHRPFLWGMVHRTRIRAAGSLSGALQDLVCSFVVAVNISISCSRSC